MTGADVTTGPSAGEELLADVLFVGAGPKTTGLLLALAAAARDARTAFPARVDIHVVDPFPAGGGRIWRHDQDRVLWMNSMARDVTIFADPDAPVGPPPITGPSLDAWMVSDEGRAVLAARGLAEVAGRLGPADFPPRRIQAAYLEWAFTRALGALPDGFTVHVRRARAVGVERVSDLDHAGHRVRLDTGESVRTAVLVLAQGFLEVENDAEVAALEAAARTHGLGYTVPGYTADLDLSHVPAGEDVLVRGFGLAFVDAMMMLTEGRGGRFEQSTDGAVRYVPCGAEPVLWVGSRRGVPYRSKLGYQPDHHRIGPARYVHAEAARRLAQGNLPPGQLPPGPGRPGTISVDSQLLPLLEIELLAAHYTELAHSHPERIRAGAEDVLRYTDVWVEAFLAGDRATADGVREGLEGFVSAVVPDAADRFDLARLDRPFAGVRAESHEEFEAALDAYIAGNLARSADPAYSQDSAVFHALVSAYFAIREWVQDGYFTDAERNRRVDGYLHGFFSYIASGPPPERLENLRALHAAGLVRFVGPEMDVEVGPAGFAARSPAHPRVVRTRHLLDARLAPVSASRATDPLLRSLIADGALLLEAGEDHQKLRTDADSRALDAESRAHPDLFLVGPSVAGSVAEAFSRPGTNSRVFRDNARLVGVLGAALGQARAASSGSGHGGERRDRALAFSPA
ncbi:FAD/NAD(P)-binding protein [Brevibacterium samyangense]|uniref:FAD/NAD(P)-binding protein n=1 Tax=Brevibacterium samyangense TaxID=366888 RepID=A0ABN2T2C8_9MICO